MKVGILGAGPSGSFLAHLFSQEGHQVTVFEKARGVGGRCTTKRLSNSKEGLSTGAQFFTTREPALEPYWEDLRKKELIQKFRSPFYYFHEETKHQERAHEKDRYHGSPSMNEFIKYWLKDSEVQLSSTITRVQKETRGWALFSKEGLSWEGFDLCVFSMPLQQGQKICNDSGLYLALPEVTYEPCWCVYLESDYEPQESSFYFIKGQTLSWVACYHKPGSKVSHWVLHGSSQWSKENSGRESSWVIEALTKEMKKSLSKSFKILSSGSHWWRYARVSKTNAKKNYWYDSSKKLGYVGDGFTGLRLESAVKSAYSFFSDFSHVKK